MAAGYEQLNVWKKAIDLADDFYDATGSFPDHERFGLTSQMRRCAVSIASNIAEGQARHSSKDFVRFLRHSKGSVAELRTQLIIAMRRHYVAEKYGSELSAKAVEIDRMLSGLIASLGEKQEEPDED